MDFITDPNFWTIGGGIIGIITLVYTIIYNQKSADIEVFFGTSTPYIDKSDLHLNFINGLSESINLSISIHNIGKKEANSIELILIFNTDVVLDSDILSEYWKSIDKLKKFRSFKYSNDNKKFPPSTNKTIGHFTIKIPDISDDNEYLIANGFFEGDFKTKCFILSICSPSLNVNSLQSGESYELRAI